MLRDSSNVSTFENNSQRVGLIEDSTEQVQHLAATVHEQGEDDVDTSYSENVGLVSKEQVEVMETLLTIDETNNTAST